VADEVNKSSGAPRRRIDSAKHWAGYGWFMSFGTILPLVVFLGSYLVHLTLVGSRPARSIDRFGIWVSTLGQEPPGKEKLDSRKSENSKRSFAERVREHGPSGYLQRRGRPVSLLVRIIWFVFVGWWLGALWVLLSWSIFLMPYPFLGTVAALLDELPTVMTLAYPASASLKTDSA
jgi:hypothetical protein